MKRVGFGIKLATIVTSLVFVGTVALSVFASTTIRDFLTTQVGLRAQSTAMAAANIIEFGLSDHMDSEDVSRVDKQLKVLGKRVDVLTLLVIDTSRKNTVTLLYDAKPSQFHTSIGDKWDASSSPIYSENSVGYSVASSYGKTKEDPMAGWAPITLRNGQQVGLSIVILDLHDEFELGRKIARLLFVLDLLLTLLAGYSSYKFSSAFEKASVTDGLMQIYNHKYFKQRLEQEVDRARRYRQPLTLVMLDLDFFKKVNDTYGHAIGDLVLRETAKTAKAGTRKTDIVCRYGGEEVAIILPHTPLRGAQEFAERMRERIEDMVIKDPEEDIELSITASIGVAPYEHGITMMELIKRTDAALYHSKRTGRNRVSIYDPEYEMAPDGAKPTDARHSEPPQHPLRREQDQELPKEEAR